MMQQQLPQAAISYPAIATCNFGQHSPLRLLLGNESFRDARVLSRRATALSNLYESKSDILVSCESNPK